jgi:flagellin
MADVVLTSALRSNLQALQLTQALIDTTQLRLSTGKKVNSALDNPQNFFAAQSLSNRASDLTRLLDGIGQSIQTVKTADKGVASVTTLVEQAESLANTAREKASSGEVVAGVTGDANIKSIEDFTTAGITAADTLTLSVIEDGNDFVRLTGDAGAAANTYTITFRAEGAIADDDEVTSVQDLINVINGIRRNSDSSQVFEAKLDSEGQLQINAKDGYTYRAVFSAERVATTLGFGKFVNNEEATDVALASAATYAFTASNKVVLESLKFTDNATGAVAKRAATLANLRDDTSTARFDGDNAGDDIIVRVQLADGTQKSLTDVLGANAISTASVGDVVDNINNNSTINPYIKASFDEETGQFLIESLDSRVTGVQIGVDDDAGANAVANFGFGAFANTLNSGATQVDITPTATNARTENILFAQGSGELANLKSQYVGLLGQIDELVDDAGYAGVNLLDGDTLTTYFNEDRSSFLETVGGSLKAGDLGLDSDVKFGTTVGIDAAITSIKTALETVRNFSSSLANDLSIIQTREGFTKGLVETLTEGSDKLTLADQNEEGAKLLSLQTRQQLGVTALSLAAQSQQAILRLF